MTHFIDRRLNPKGKSLGNRQRFLKRARTQIREAVQKSLKDSAVADLAKDRKIKISTRGTKEPRFRLDPKTAGERDFVLPGNRDFTPGDEIKKPKSGGGNARGKEAADSGDGEDDFEFTMTQEEVLDIFFEDLELPNLVRTTLKETLVKTWRRAGTTTAGSPNQINLIRTMRNAYGRRLALKRPKLEDVKALEEDLDKVEREPETEETRARISVLKEQIARAHAKRKWVGFIDPVDVRFNAFTEQAVPTSQAVMFCLMDVSGSMGEREKDLAKRFYMLLHLFLKRRYEKVEVVFIRHTHDAQEVDEHEFFYSRQSGGTIVSTALDKMIEIQKERYTTADWNIYAAQASDGYTQTGDARHCVELLNGEIMPLCQYYAYIEILDEREMEVFASEDSGAELWRAYRTVASFWSNFATKRIARPADIFPVFHELFRKTGGLVMTEPLFTGAEWDFATLDRTYKAIEDIALKDLGLDVYPNQVEIISSEQMLDAYSSLAMPLMYSHWSFGKLFAREETMYRAGYSALAYEIVINSSPCISYLLEENTMTMQALVMAHAAFGHNHFFKNNYLFRQWTNAEGILDYLAFAKRYIAACEERHGRGEVEGVLDAAHALMDQGVFRYRRPPRPSKERVLEKHRRRMAYEEEAYSELWRTLPAGIEPPAAPPTPDPDAEFDIDEKLPEENILYFLEKHSPSLRPWQRETLRIVRNLAQYFYPQRQLKVMNEGCATFVHYTIMNLLYDRGLINEGSLLEFMHSHTSVVFQPEFSDKRYYGINPYALGYAMMEDIRRIAEKPTAEDRDWFPELAGSGDYMAALKYAWANYRDESFIEQYLSPKLMRDFRFFALFDKADAETYKVSAIHNERGYREVRAALAGQYDTSGDPNIQVARADLKGNRTLYLEHHMHRGVPLHNQTKEHVLAHVELLWGHDVVLDEVAD